MKRMAFPFVLLLLCSSQCGAPEYPERNSDDLFKIPETHVEYKNVIKLLKDFSDFVTSISVADSTALSSGVNEYYLELSTNKTNPLKVCVFEVDLSDLNTTLEVTYPTDVSSSWPVRNMVTQASAIDREGHRVIGAVNADFFDMGGSGYPLGSVWHDGKEIKSDFTAGAEGTFFCLTRSNRPVMGDLADYVKLNRADISELVCGLYPLVRGGSSVCSYDDAKAPRTAIGASRDLKTVYVVVVDELEPASPRDGISLYDLSRLMVQIGCCDAINFDGGGSSTFVVRNPDGSFSTPNKQPGAWLRPVANGLAIIGLK